MIGSARYYERVFSRNLRKHLRLVFMDHRGFAPAPGPVEKSVMIGIAPDMSPASAALAERNFHELADADRIAAEQQNMLSFPADQRAALPPDQAFVRWCIRNAARFWYNPRFDATPLGEGVTPKVQVFDYVWGKVFAGIDVTEGIEELEVPGFLALGRYDFVVAPPSSWEPLQPKFRSLTIRVFERSGHTPQLEESELFDRELLRWMQQVHERA